MNLLKRTIWSKTAILILFLGLHIFLLNINVAEWGDSYRILRAAEYIRHGTYPSDEKRLPVYSAVLAVRPPFVEQIFWGRIVMLVVSILSFYMFGKLVTHFIKNESYQKLSLLFFALNPVYLYWSIRIYADAFFTLLALTAFYLLITITREKLMSTKKVILLAVLTGLAILTRFEGYFLFVSLAVGLIYSEGIHRFDVQNLFSRLKSRLLFAFVYVYTTAMVITPWLFFRNPFNSTYFEETGGRSYDLKMVWIYLVSLIFIFGIVPAFSFIITNRKNLFNFLKTNLGIGIFILLELVLILVWPAAVPRLFVPIIPFFVLLLVLSIQNYFDIAKELTHAKINNITYFSFALLLLFIVSQYFLKLQFLVPLKTVFIIVTLLQFGVIFAVFKKHLGLFVIISFMSMLLWALSSIWLHKDMFIAVKTGAEYVSRNISGTVIYNDVSSVSDWYINQVGRKDLSGFYYNFENNKRLTFESLSKLNFDYMLITNEHNTTMDIDLSKRPYLILEKEFRYNIYGKSFFSQIVRFNKNYDDSVVYRKR